MPTQMTPAMGGKVWQPRNAKADEKKATKLFWIANWSIIIALLVTMTQAYLMGSLAFTVDSSNKAFIIIGFYAGSLFFSIFASTRFYVVPLQLLTSKKRTVFIGFMFPLLALTYLLSLAAFIITFTRWYAAIH